MTVHPFLVRLQATDPLRRIGRVRRVMPTFIEADGPDAALGALCEILPREGAPVVAQVVGVAPQGVVLAPLTEAARIGFGDLVADLPQDRLDLALDQARGRAIDALGRPIDGGEPLERRPPAEVVPRGALQRGDAARPLVTGVRAIDGLLTLAEGQRVGLFAASGVGKTSLLTQLARQIKADAYVICLVGERGREVEALWSRTLPQEVRERSVLVAATSDETAAMRARACELALRIAEQWRAQGQHVLLLIDSISRLAMALREVGLAAGEPPTVRAYTPGVFAQIPRIVERCGAAHGEGAITAIMTVLCETDDADDPVAEMMKSLLDGHIVLSRNLAEQGHFPAIDVPRSLSRLARGLVDPPRRKLADRAVALLATHEQARTLIDSGVYAKGSQPEIDQAIALRPALTAFLRQDQSESSPLERTWAALSDALVGAAA